MRFHAVRRIASAGLTSTCVRFAVVAHLSLQGFNRPKAATLKYVNGYPIVQDVDPANDPLNQRFRWQNGRVQDLGPVPPFAVHEEAGGPPPAPPPPQPQPPAAEPLGASASRGGLPNWLANYRKVLGFAG